MHHSHRDALPATDLAWIAAAATTIGCSRPGVRVYENRHGEHSKIVLVDGAWVAFGSYNFEHAAHDRLAEAMLASRDPRAIEPAAAIFEELRRHPDNVLVTPRVVRRAAGAAARPASRSIRPVQAVDVMRFKEIEHKFIVDEQFDLPRLPARARRARAQRARPALRVRDRYFLTDGGRARRFCSGIATMPSCIT